MAEAADSQASADWVTLCLACDAPLPEGEPRGYEMSCAECGGNDFYWSKNPTKKITAYGTWVFVPHGSAPQEPLGDQEQAPPGAPGGGHSTTSSATTWSIPRASRNAGSRAGHGDPPDEPELGHVREEAESEVPTQDPTVDPNEPPARNEPGHRARPKAAAGPGVPRVGDLQDIEPVPEDPTGDLRRGLLHDKASSSWNSRMGPERGIRFRSGAPPVPPKWSYSREDVRSFAKFERKVQLWRMQIRAWMPLNEPAMLLYGALTGEAEDETENLDLEKVNSPGGLDYIMNSLKDGLQSKVVFQKRKLLHDFESVSRYNNESMRSYTSRYRRTEQALQSVGIQVSGMYDKEARGSRLLDRAKLTPESQRLVLIGCGYRLDFASISDSLNMSFPEHKQPPPVVGRDGLPYRGGKGRDTSSGHPGGKGQGAGREKGKGNPFTSKGYSGNKGNGKFEKATVYQTDLVEDDEEFDGEDANQFGDDTEEYQDFPEEGDEHDPGHGEDAQEADREDVDLQGLAQVLTVTARKLSGITLGRKFSGGKRSPQEMKRTTHCSACGALGHWAGDPECTASSKGGKDASKGKSNSKDKGSGAKKVLRILHHDAGSTVVRETEEDQGTEYVLGQHDLFGERGLFGGRWRVPVFEPFGFGHRMPTYVLWDQMGQMS